MNQNITKIFRQQIRTIAKGIEIKDEHSYLLNGEKIHVLNVQPHQNFYGELDQFGENLLNGEGVNWLNQHLSGSIYSYYYTGMNELHKAGYQFPPLEERNQFMDELSANNFTENGWDTNWRVYSIDKAGNVYASKNGIAKMVYPNTWKFSNAAQKEMSVNSYIDFSILRENREAQPVFYYVYGKSQLPQDAEITRIYWSIKPEAASRLVSLITTYFNNYRIPFQFKCLNHPDLYNRTDSAVLYLDKPNLQLALLLVKELAAQLKEELREEVPLFACPIYKGVAFAEDPGNAQSFGMSRSQIIAKGLVKAFQKEAKTLKEKEECIYQQLDANGITVDRLFLHHHSNPEFVLDALPS